MTLTVTNRGTAQDKAAGSLSITPASNCTAGALLLLAVSYDNSGASGADPFVGVTDTSGNTWTTRLNELNDPGSANAGVAFRLFESTQNAGTLTTSSTITVNVGLSTTAKAATLTELTGTLGVATYVTGASATGSGASPSITTGTITSGNVVFGAVGRENDTAMTADSDTTNGSWSTAQLTNTTGGSVDTNQSVISQAKVVTATATQTYNVSGGVQEWCILWAEYTETVTGIHNHLISTRLRRCSKVTA